MADTHDSTQQRKWEAYYATDPLTAPWDTHAVSSQLRSYLCSCPSPDGSTGAGGHSSGARRADHADGPSGSTPHRVHPIPHSSHLCSHEKPAPGRPLEDSPPAHPQAGPDVRAGGIVRALELCCGTGASLAFMRQLGYAVMGVELVEAACQVAAARLGAAVAASAPAVAVQSVETVGEELRRWRLDQAAACPDGEAAPPALLAHGNLFAAQLPGGFFDFAYDCQGLHAMPPELRPAYVAVLRGALRRGGLVLLLVGRRESDQEATAASAAIDAAAASAGAAAATGADGVGQAQAEAGQSAAAAALHPSAAVEAETAAAAGGGAQCGGGAPSIGDGRSGDGGGGGGDGGMGSAVSSRGPSLMPLGELCALFGPEEWDWCWCRPTRFDLTAAYLRLPAPPPAWCLLARRR